MQKQYLKLNDIDAYKTGFHLANRVWNLAIYWDSFAKNTIGIQFVRAVDSISANLAEGFGRYTKKDKIRFYRMSQGSTKECLDWNQKAKVRQLLSDSEHELILSQLLLLSKEINQLIKYTNLRLKI